MTPEMFRVTEYDPDGRRREYLSSCPDVVPWVAVRHGVILGTGDSRAAAATATHVSRCELRLASPWERCLLKSLAGRRLPADTEAGLLEAIRTDISRVLAAADDDDTGYEHIHAPVLLEYRSIDLDRLSPDEYDALEARREAALDELAELAALAGQHDLFAGAPA